MRCCGGQHLDVLVQLAGEDESSRRNMAGRDLGLSCGRPRMRRRLLLMHVGPGQSMMRYSACRRQGRLPPNSPSRGPIARQRRQKRYPYRRPGIRVRPSSRSCPRFSRGACPPSIRRASHPGQLGEAADPTHKRAAACCTRDAAGTKIFGGADNDGLAHVGGRMRIVEEKARLGARGLVDG